MLKRSLLVLLLAAVGLGSFPAMGALPKEAPATRAKHTRAKVTATKTKPQTKRAKKVAKKRSGSGG